MQTSIEKLLATLLDGTRNGTIEWERTTRKTEFRTNFKFGSITVDKWDWTDPQSDEPGTSADIAVYNEDGEKIDTCVASDGADFAKISQLHETVRRKVLKIDETIESMFKELLIKVSGTNKSK